jgi:capsular exopolysaccharide family
MNIKRELITHRDPKSPVAEVFRTLRTNIQFMDTSKKMKILLLTSTFPGEGKSWVSSNLAVTFAQAGKKVILIDADMRKGRQYTIFGISPRPGLSNYLSEIDMENPDSIDISKYLQKTEIENLSVMVAGNVPPNPSELLVSQQMTKLLEDLKQICDLVIIDGTPCELVTDSVILSRIADATVIVTAHKETKKDNLERVIKSIQNVGGKLAGVVINKMPISAKKYNERYYYHSATTPKNTQANIEKRGEQK